MNNAFDAYVQKLLDSEGRDKFTNDPDDLGRKTKYGVTEATLGDAIARKVVEQVAIEDLTEEQAITIYREMFWKVIRGDVLPPAIAYAVFDAALPSGPGGAVMILQETLNAGPWYSGLTVDGGLGMKTLTAMQKAKTSDLLDAFSAHRAMEYAGIVAKRPNQAKFFDGWNRRAFRVNREAGALLA